MNSIVISKTDNLVKLKKLATIVYLCQVLTFFLAGLPLLIGIASNFMYRNDTEGTWLQSHFNWQIKTAWITLAGFALSGLTFTMGLGFYILLPTLVLLVYRIVVGWNTLNDSKPMTDLD